MYIGGITGAKDCIDCQSTCPYVVPISLDVNIMQHLERLKKSKSGRERDLGGSVVAPVSFFGVVRGAASNMMEPHSTS